MFKQSEPFVLEMFKQREPFGVNDDIPVSENTRHADPVSVDNKNLSYNHSDGYRTLGVIFHCKENVSISIATRGPKTLIGYYCFEPQEYYLLERQYLIAHLKAVDGALIMNVFPNNPHIPLAFSE